MSDTVKTVCERCNGKGYGSPYIGAVVAYVPCYECSGDGFVWSRVWTQDDAEARVEWIRANMPHLLASDKE